jgi:hypothetical protein
MTKDYKELFKALSDSLDLFIREVHMHNLKDMATDEWSVKDELSHISFWHTYYAKNYESSASGTTPFVFKGSSTRNRESVRKLRHYSRKELINKLNRAQISLYESIVIKKVPQMTYTVGREYATDNFLDMITRHIQRHTLQVRRSKRIKA